MKTKELILVYREETHYLPCEEEDDEERSEHEIEWEPLNIYIDERYKKARQKTKEWKIECLSHDNTIKIGDTVYLLVIRYTYGGTFDTTRGAWLIEGVYKKEALAKEVEQTILKDDEAYRNASMHHKKYQPKYKGGRYESWHGYFNSLDTTSIYSLKVE